MTDLYFAYGSNMSRARLDARIEGAERVCVARLAGWRLAYNKPGRDESGKANLVQDAADHAFGVVWRVAPSDWPALDRYEPGYARTQHDVVDEAGGVHHAQLYLHPARGAGIAPHAWYVQHLIDGAREHGLPAAYLRRLIGVATR